MQISMGKYSLDDAVMWSPKCILRLRVNCFNEPILWLMFKTENKNSHVQTNNFITNRTKKIPWNY